MVIHRVTNPEFGDTVGCDYTTASRLRSGERLPSRSLLSSIVKAYNLDANEALDAADKGGEEFAKYLDEMVFNPPDTDNPDDIADALIEDVIEDASVDTPSET